jgi:hypothetical protein
MSLLGKIEDITIPEILQTLGRGKHSGILDLTLEERRGRLVLNEGRVVSANSDRAPKLGHILVRKGFIAIQQLKDVVRKQRQSDSNMSLGTLLVEGGYITGERLEAELLDQILKVLKDVLSWQSGVFHFQKIREPARCLLHRDGFTIEYLLLEYMRSCDEHVDQFLRLLRSAVPDLDAGADGLRAPVEDRLVRSDTAIGVS